MHRVLSFQMMAGRGFGESSEFVTKRMCFSFIFFIGFLALIGGFLLGRFSTERTMQLREERKRLELAESVLEVAGPQQHYDLLLEEFEKSSYDQFHLTKMSEKNSKENTIDHENVKTILSNFDLFHKVVKNGSTVVATLRGSREPDRWVVLSVSGDGIKVAIQLAQIFAKFRVNHKWKPQKTLVFCFLDQPHDSWHDNLPKYLKSRIVAYLSVHGNAIQKNGCFVASGSDIVRSVVIQEAGMVQESLFLHNSDDRRVFESCKIGDDLKRRIFLPRLLSDVPHALLTFKNRNSTNINFENDVATLPYRKALVQIIGRVIWKFSESVIPHWDEKDFEMNIKTTLNMINSSQFSEIEEKITATTKNLVDGVKSLSEKINGMGEFSSLNSRMANDLLEDLDRALLCPDIDFRSKTDLALVPGLLNKSSDTISSFLVNMLKCYEDAVEILQEG